MTGTFRASALGGAFGRVARVILAGQLARVAIQAAYFVVLARVLGVREFGVFSALIALSALLVPFSTLGSNVLLIRNVARDASLAAAQWGNTIILTLASGTLMGSLLAGLASRVAPVGVSATTVALIAFSELVLARLVETAGLVAHAQDRPNRLAIYPVALNGLRLAAVAWISTTGSVRLDDWAVAYFLATLVVSVVAVCEITYSIGGLSANLRAYRAEWRDGILFAVGLSSQTIYNDIDKAMLGRLAVAVETGAYSAAYRIIDMVYTPVRAIASAAYPRFFRYGSAGAVSVVRFARHLAPFVLGYCALASTALFILADMVPLILGTDYSAAVPLVRALAVVPLLRGIAYLAADSLAGIGRQGVRTSLQALVAGLNIALNLWLIPAYGAEGAVISSIFCDAALAFGFWLTLLRLRRLEAASDAA